MYGRRCVRLLFLADQIASSIPDFFTMPKAMKAIGQEGSGTSPSDESQEGHEVNRLAARRSGKSHWRPIKAVGMKGACEISGCDLAWRDRA